MSSHFEDEMNVIFKFLVVSVFFGPNCRPVVLFTDFKTSSEFVWDRSSCTSRSIQSCHRGSERVENRREKNKNKKQKGLGHQDTARNLLLVEGNQPALQQAHTSSKPFLQSVYKKCLERLRRRLRAINIGHNFICATQADAVSVQFLSHRKQNQTLETRKTFFNPY